MPAGSSDSIEVIQFMAAFHRAKEACDNDPKHLVSMCANDAAFLEEMRDLHSKYRKISARVPKLVYPVNPPINDAIRDFQKRYLPNIRRIIRDWSAQNGYLGDLGDAQPRSDEIHSRITDTALDALWERANEIAQEEGACVEFAAESVDELCDFVCQSSEFGETDEIIYIRRGMDAFDSFLDYLDPRSVRRRILMLPDIMMPRDISMAPHGKEDHSLMVALDGAQRSFVFGIFGATYAMLRTAMEHMVYKQYGSRESDFWKALNSKLLPIGVDKDRLQDIRKRTNDILHNQHLTDFREGKENLRNIEISLLRHMICVRDLVELYRRIPRLRTV